jgi:acyl transferase domain-containing protein
MAANVCVLFPGQGAYAPGLLADLRTAQPEVEQVFAEIDEVARAEWGTNVSHVVFDPAASSLGELMRSANDVLQLAIYGTSIALFRVLQARGVGIARLMGHSFGEIAALVAGGAFTTRQGAQLVCQRSRALQEVGFGRGYMVALATEADKVQHLVALAGPDHAAVAVENFPGQTVVSGATEAMDQIVAIAGRLGIGATRLDSAFPFHSAVMTPAVKALAARASGVQRKPFRIPVFSPILGRLYSDEDDLAECLARHLVTPVRFQTGLVAAYEAGSRTFLEAGALATLSKITRRVLPPAEVKVWPLLDGRSSAGNLESTLQAAGLSGAPAAAGRAASVSERFWAQQGDDILAMVKQRISAFLMADAAGTMAAPAVVAESSASQPRFAAPAAATAAHLSNSPRPSFEQILTELTELYAQALEYPAEVFTKDVALEAELGVDSVKQTELFARVVEKYGLPPRPAGFRLADYQRFGAVAELVLGQLNAPATVATAAPVTAAPAAVPTAAPAPVALVAPAPAPSVRRAPAALVPPRQRLTAELRSLYAGALEYPEEVFTDGALFEAELGIDSVKQAELFSRVAEEYHLPPSPAGFRLNDYQNLAAIVDLVLEQMAPPEPARGSAHSEGREENGASRHPIGFAAAS